MKRTKAARQERPVEPLVGHVVNPHVLPYAHEPQPDFEAMLELISGVRSINCARHHEVRISGDDEPCYWQRREWVHWLLELADAAENALLTPNAPHQPRERSAATGTSAACDG